MISYDVPSSLRFIWCLQCDIVLCMLIVNCNITVKMNCKQIVEIIRLHEMLFSSVIILHSMYFVVEFLFSFKKFVENVKILLKLNYLLHLRIEPGLPRVGR